MKIDISPRQMGKTTRMIEWLSEDKDRLLIVMNHQRENQLKRQFPGSETQIIDWQSYRNRYQPATAHIKEVGIDDADIILQSIVDKPINRISMTGTDKTKI